LALSKERRERKEKPNFELRKFAWSQDAACSKSKPSFLFSALSAFSAFFAVE
jgi:hypothetical protein